jgi:hypothetical protein
MQFLQFKIGQAILLSEYVNIDTVLKQLDINPIADRGCVIVRHSLVLEMIYPTDGVSRLSGFPA